MSRLRQREPRYENRRLLDLAHSVELCMNCERPRQGEGYGMDPAHENGLEGGKAQGTKSHDNRHAALCHECHGWYDTGKGKDPSGVWSDCRQGKHEMFVRAHMRTFDHYWRMGWLKVIA